MCGIAITIINIYTVTSSWALYAHISSKLHQQYLLICYDDNIIISLRFGSCVCDCACMIVFEVVSDMIWYDILDKRSNHSINNEVIEKKCLYIDNKVQVFLRLFLNYQYIKLYVYAFIVIKLDKNFLRFFDGVKHTKNHAQNARYTKILLFK